ncbi:DBP [Baboon adenovirus 3]|uniref:DNA-binding protein n=1 Tax=Simian mastadenovirus C TaxID=1962300 RepID=M9Z4R7_9ADEN|nr:DBP [Baboon adenovirus 3]AGK27140.1 DBP [Baboon adenovirus 3]AGK27212.1 DBP [Simian mastadenovirus C]
MAGNQNPGERSITPYLRERSPERDVAVPLPPKKKARKSSQARPPSPEIISDSEGEGTVIGVGFSYPPVRIVKQADGGRVFQRVTVEEANPEREERSSVLVVNPHSSPLVTAWEKGMEAMMILMEKFHVPHEDRATFKFLPEQGPVYRKICQTWLNEEHRGLALTFTSNKTFTEMMGRFLMAYMQSYAGVVQKNWEATGCAVWQHRSAKEDGVLCCFHGTEMIRKEHVTEMDVTSENGQKALKENPGKAKVVQNRWGRNVVQIRNDDARCCPEDVSCGPNVFSGKSCGLFYTEGLKAQMAFRQLEAFLRASYPEMQRGQGRILIPLRCDCLHKPDVIPRMGRQMCKVTPYGLSNADDLDVAEVNDATALASIKYPSVLVFQCANPVYRNSRGGAAPNCDFKISGPDIIGALQLVRQFWKENMEDKPLPKMIIPEFRWHPRFQYRNVALPSSHGDDCPEPFEF